MINKKVLSHVISSRRLQKPLVSDSHQNSERILRTCSRHGINTIHQPVMLMNKRGLSHVEMILSFVIFFSFLVFVYIYLIPHFKIIPDYSSLDNAEKQITGYVRMNVDYFSLAVKDVNQDCFSVPNFGKALSNSYILVKNKGEKIVNSELLNDRILIENSGNFYYLYFLEDFKTETGSFKNCKTLEEAKEDKTADYELGSKRSETWTSFNKLKELEEDYKTSYADLKEKIGIKQDFAFSLTSSAGEVLIKADREKPVKNVLAKELVVKVYNENSDNIIENNVLTILVW